MYFPLSSVCMYFMYKTRLLAEAQGSISKYKTNIKPLKAAKKKCSRITELERNANKRLSEAGVPNLFEPVGTIEIWTQGAVSTCA